MDRVRRYLILARPGVKIKTYLGGGTDGHVWQTSEETAVKSYHHDLGYFNERDSYQRLAEYGVVERLEGFWVPRMLGYDDDIKVVEMDLMQQPPYIIDFAKVRIDRPPDFSADVLAEQERQGREHFEQHWPTVQALLFALESFQIYYLDPKPGNITFPDMP